MNTTSDFRRANLVTMISRVSLALVWIYEGLVPKILFLNANPVQLEMVRRSRIFWPTPEWTLVALGAAQVLFGVILLSGWRQRAMVAVATGWMGVLIVLVVLEKPDMLTDPFGALAKDLCLIVCAATVWLLAPNDVDTPL